MASSKILKPRYYDNPGITITPKNMRCYIPETNRWLIVFPRGLNLIHIYTHRRERECTTTPEESTNEEPLFRHREGESEPDKMLHVIGGREIGALAAFSLTGLSVSVMRGRLIWCAVFLRESERFTFIGLTNFLMRRRDVIEFCFLFSFFFFIYLYRDDDLCFLFVFLIRDDFCMWENHEWLIKVCVFIQCWISANWRDQIFTHDSRV